MGFFVEIPGVLTTIQDSGRFGYEKYGVSPAGPMDRTSFEIANILVGNERSAAALEITMLGPTLRFTSDSIIAITGADMSPRLNETPCPNNQAISVRTGDVLRMGSAKNGCRSYIAFSGGIQVAPVMGSRATGIQNQVGGYQGRKLAKGDEVPLAAPSVSLPNLTQRKTDCHIQASGEITLRVILGPQDDFFTAEGIATFLSQPYHVTNDFDRMGCRLEGAVIQHNGDGNIISDGMVTGAIQVPTSGQPIIMLSERQTVGGYTKIATVISADLPLIGQCRPGNTVRFQSVSVAEAQNVWRQSRQALDQLENQLKTAMPPSGSSRRYRLTVDGKQFDVAIERL